MTMTRIQKWKIPNTPSFCRLEKFCVYRDTTKICDDPRINNGNGDSACHKMLNKDIIKLLAEVL